MENNITKKILNTIREGVEQNRHYTANPIVDEEYVPKPTFLSEARELMEEAVKKKINESSDDKEDESVEIKANTPQFGDVYTKQTEQVRKTLNEDIEFKLKYIPSVDDLTLNGKVKSLNIVFQYRFRDPSNIGCYVWCNMLQLTEENTRFVGKIRDAYLNWKKSLIEDADLMEKLKKTSENK